MAGFIGTRASVVSSGAERKQHYNITTTTTSLTGLQYTPTKVHVYHNGIRLVDGTDYTATNGTSITLTNAAEDGDDVVVISYATFQVSDTVSAANGGTFAGNVTVSGDLNTSTVLPSSDDAKDLGTSVKRFQDLYLSGGLYVGGTGSANKLDDYEQGTWTVGMNTGVTLTSGSAASGIYTKIGRMVFASCLVTPSAVTSSSTFFDVTGLPFTASSSTYAFGGGSAMSQHLMSSAQQLLPFVGNGNDYIRLYQCDNGAWDRIQHSDASTSTDIYITVNYYV